MICTRSVLVVVVVALCSAGAGRAHAHDLERTRVSIVFARDGSFVLDVTNDPNWLLLRLEPFAGLPARGSPALDQRDRRLAELASVFVDRVVIFVDGHEVRPDSAEYLPPGAVAQSDPATPLAAYRLRGRVPTDARTLRWFYGLVIDPYPLTVRHAGGRPTTNWIGGTDWSGTFALTGHFRRSALADDAALALMLGLVVLALGVRLSGRRVGLRTARG